jgi:hypothetical protein
MRGAISLSSSGHYPLMPKFEQGKSVLPHRPHGAIDEITSWGKGRLG